MSAVPAGYHFNPRAVAGPHVVQPRPYDVLLTETSIFDSKDPRLANEVLNERFRQLGRRNAAQAAALPAPGTYRLVPIHHIAGKTADDTGTALETMFGNDLAWAYRCYEIAHNGHTNLAGQPLFQSHLYLFNVLIGFEWRPSMQNVMMVERAARRAADFLFDVTDGWMTFGQVVIGGPELLNCADIQVMASNRLHPRSWVGGLHDEKKYMPIRLGRGMWQKNNRGSIPWDEPEGYRVLVHEWAHYALELLDDYIAVHEVYIPEDVNAIQGPNEARRSNRSLAVPSISQPVESIMATLEGTSELTAKAGTKGKRAEWDSLIEGFYGVSGPRVPRFPRIQHNVVGELAFQPVEGPLPLRELPHVAVLSQGDTTPTWSQELLLTRLPLQVRPDHCWVYILKDLDADGIPGAIIAQGTVDQLRGGGFRLFGAEANDTIVLIGNGIDWRERVLVARIDRFEPDPDPEGRRLIGELDWRAVEPTPFPMIDVIPERVGNPSQRTAQVSVQVTVSDGSTLQTPAVEHVAIFPLDQVNSPAGKGDRRIDLRPGMATPEPVALDGHVFVKLADGTWVIATYAQGGGPPTDSPGGSSPITPGSSEGNLMVFFNDQDEYPRFNTHHGAIRVITTRLPGGTPTSLPTGAEARGYAYTLCSNSALPADYLPTLSLAYDKRTELMDGIALIHRQTDDGTWEPVSTYRPNGAWFVSMPLDEKTAPRLINPDWPKDQPRVEHYRLYLVPRAAAHAED